MPKRVPPPIPSQIVADGQQACIESVFKERTMLEYIHMYTINSGGHFQEFAVANWVEFQSSFLNRQGRQERQGNAGIFNHETHENDERRS